MQETLNRIKSELGSATLMAVSKTHPYDMIREAYGYGQRLFGENRVQEVLEKFPTKKERPEDMELHLIGHLQSNKVRKIITEVDSIDSVDSIRLAQLIDRAALERNLVMDILIEVNTSGEESKSGFESEDDVFTLLDMASEMKGVRIRGFMTVGPITDDENRIRESFLYLRDLRDRAQKMHPEMDFGTLSMGMSADWKIALECGSTMVRIGTAIFGHRDYGNR